MVIKEWVTLRAFSFERRWLQQELRSRRQQVLLKEETPPQGKRGRGHWESGETERRTQGERYGQWESRAVPVPVRGAGPVGRRAEGAGRVLGGRAARRRAALGAGGRGRGRGRGRGGGRGGPGRRRPLAARPARPRRGAAAAVARAAKHNNRHRPTVAGRRSRLRAGGQQLSAAASLPPQRHFGIRS